MRPFNGQAADWRVLAGVAALHAAAALALLSMEPVARAVGLPKPLMVSLLASEPEPPQVQPKPLPPKLSPPRTEPVQRNLPPPILSVPEAAPTPRLVEAPLTPPEPLPAVLPPPAPEPVRPGPVAAYTPPAPAPMTPPRFDADYLDNPAPAYPALSRSLGEEGRVLLRVFVNPDGSAAQVEVRDGSGFERLDKVAGPVGEALIMTALGLAVAIPAVLAYNAFNRSNRLVLAELDGFAHDLFAFMSTGIHAEAPRRDGKLATPRPAAAPRTLAMEAR